MKNTLDDVMKELLTPEEIEEIESDVKKEVAKFRGGYRKGAGRKKKDEDNVLKFQVRVSKKEKAFLAYAREHHINYDNLMQG